MLALKFAYKSQSQWLPLIRALFHFRILDLFFEPTKLVITFVLAVKPGWTRLSAAFELFGFFLKTFNDSFFNYLERLRV